MRLARVVLFYSGKSNVQTWKFFATLSLVLFWAAMNDIKKLTRKILRFRDERAWKPFHNPKDMALSLVLEATEVLEHFQWKTERECREHIRHHKNDVAEELADTLYWVLLMSHEFGIDLRKALPRKLKKNAAKYPLEESRRLSHIRISRRIRKTRVKKVP